jgi:hypothetical protein
MRAIMIAVVAAGAVGFFGPAGVSAAPLNGAAVGKAAAAGQLIEKARYRRSPRRRRVPYYSYGPYERAEPYGDETLHQLSQENTQRAQQNVGGWSDIRLKHHITLLGHLDNGLGYYRFRYKGSDKDYVGVMAQEVAIGQA